MANRLPFTRRFLSLAFRGGAFAVALGIVASCQSDRSTGLPLGDVGLAKGGGGGGGGGGSGVAPTVTSTLPSSAHQDTTISVRIFGSGFTTGAKAAWSLNGDTTRVHVKSTRVLSSTELEAQIVVPADAPVASYDVVVTLSSGKNGVGAEMFDVLYGDPTTTFLFPINDPTLDVQSDGEFTVDTNSVYASGVCGVGGQIFATEAASNSGDATLGMSNPRNKDRTCAAYPRKVTVRYADGVQTTGSIFMNVRHIHNTTFEIPVGTTDRHILSTNYESRCDGLRWTTVAPDGSYLGGDSVNVTRVDASTWLVESQPYPKNKAYCTKDGQLYHLDVQFTVVSSRPLP